MGKTAEVEADLKGIGQRLRKLRMSDPRMSQEELAKKVGTTQSQISRFERGERGLESHIVLGILTVIAQRGGSLEYCLLGSERFSDEVFLGALPKVVSELREFLKRQALLSTEPGSDSIPSPLRS